MALKLSLHLLLFFTLYIVTETRSQQGYVYSTAIRQKRDGEYFRAVVKREKLSAKRRQYNDRFGDNLNVISEYSDNNGGHSAIHEKPLGIHVKYKSGLGEKYKHSNTNIKDSGKHGKSSGKNGSKKRVKLSGKHGEKSSKRKGYSDNRVKHNSKRKKISIKHGHYNTKSGKYTKHKVHRHSALRSQHKIGAKNNGYSRKNSGQGRRNKPKGNGKYNAIHKKNNDDHVRHNSKHDKANDREKGRYSVIHEEHGNKHISYSGKHSDLYNEQKKQSTLHVRRKNKHVAHRNKYVEESAKDEESNEELDRHSNELHESNSIHEELSNIYGKNQDQSSSHKSKNNGQIEEDSYAATSGNYDYGKRLGHNRLGKSMSSLLSSIHYLSKSKNRLSNELTDNRLIKGHHWSNGQSKELKTNNNPHETFIFQYRKSRSLYKDFLIGLANYDLGRLYYYTHQGKHRATENFIEPKDEATCTFRLKEHGKVIVLRIPCDIVSSFRIGSKKLNIRKQCISNLTVIIKKLDLKKPQIVIKEINDISVTTEDYDVVTSRFYVDLLNDLKMMNGDYYNDQEDIKNRVASDMVIDSYDDNDAIYRTRSVKSKNSKQIQNTTSDKTIITSTSNNGSAIITNETTITKFEKRYNITVCHETYQNIDIDNPLSVKGSLGDVSRMGCAIDIRTNEEYLRNIVDCRELITYSKMPIPTFETSVDFVEIKATPKSWKSKPPWWVSMFVAA